MCTIRIATLGKRRKIENLTSSVWYAEQDYNIGKLRWWFTFLLILLFLLLVFIFSSIHSLSLSIVEQTLTKLMCTLNKKIIYFLSFRIVFPLYVSSISLKFCLRSCTINRSNWSVDVVMGVCVCLPERESERGKDVET